MNERNITLISQTPRSVFSPLVVSREVTEIWDFVLHLTLLDKLTSCRITPFLSSMEEAVWHLHRLLRSSSAVTASLLETILSSPLAYHTGLVVQLSSSQRPRNIWQCNRSKIFPVWFCSELYKANRRCRGTGDLKDFSSGVLPLGFGFSCSPCRQTFGS